MDSRGYLSLGNLEEKNKPIPDLFDYYHEEKVKKKNNFNIGKIEQGQYDELKELLEHSALFVWE
ncbi:24750_t:CDS:1, partial [Gigaspora margarita]